MEQLDTLYFIKLALVGILIYFANFLIKRTIEKLTEKSKGLHEKNKETINNVTHHLLIGAGVIIFVIYALSPFIQFDKLLAGAGVLGIVIGFASQNILKDLFAGFFRISTKQIHRGDLVMINGKQRGTVEEIGMLYLQIREWDGKLTTVNNGEIREIQNFNMDKMRVIVNVVTSFRENPKKVISVLENVCEKLNEEHETLLLEGELRQPFQVYGLTNTNEQFFGYQYTLIGLVKDHAYFDAMNHARLAVAQAMFDNNIQMAEQHIYYKTRAELKKMQEDR